MTVTADEIKRELLRRKLERLSEKAREDFFSFTMFVARSYYSPNWHHRDIADTLEDFLADPDFNRLMLFIPPQHGKLLSHDTPVLSTKGWTTHGKLKVGDYVFGRQGQPVRVEATSEEGFADVEVTFTDGCKIVCHEKHEWLVFDRKKSLFPERKVETKEFLENDVWLGEKGKRGSRGRYQVDANVGVDFPHQDFQLPPYVLGVWLGDGSTTKNCVTYHPDDISIIEKIESLGIERTSTNTHKDTGINTDYFRNLYRLLLNESLIGNKHIPKKYLTSSRSQRLELLAGLIDTDGYVYHKNGRITFSSCSVRLIEDVKKLVISLGWRVTICKFAPVKSSSGIQGKNPVFQLCFNPDCSIPVALERKKIQSKNPKVKRRAISSVQKLQKAKKGRCIQVEGGIYLAGETLIPTHNSTLASQLFPANVLGRHPDHQIVISSYSADLAKSFNESVQKVLQSPEYLTLFPKTKLAKCKGEETALANGKGKIRAVGVTGGLTGHSVDLAIIDDPIKDDIEAQSKTYRERVWQWYLKVLETRLHTKSKVVLILTRWHMDDLAGRLLEQEPEKWEVVKYPAIREDMDDEFDPRKVGEALWPEKHSLESLLDKRKKSEVTFASLYQQRPAPAEGNKVKREWWQYCQLHEVPDDLTWDLWVDGAYTKSTANDPTGLMVAGYHRQTNRLYVRHCEDAYLEMPQLLNLLAKFPERHAIGNRSKCYIEPKASGKSLKQMVNAMRMGLSAVEIKTHLVREGKEARLQVAAPKVEAGQVILLRGGWNQQFTDQICTFPNAPHDEYVDLLGYACDRYFSGAKKLRMYSAS